MQKKILFLLSFIFFNLSVYSQNRLDSLEEALDYYITNKIEDTSSIHILKKMSELSRSSNPQLAIEYAAHALQISRKLKDSIQIASMYNYLGEIFFEKNEYFISMSYFLEAFKIFNQANRNKEAGYTLLYIANTYLAQDINETAFDNYKKAQYYFTLCNDKAGQALTLIKIGQLYLKQDINEVANGYFLQSFEIIKKNGNSEIEAELNYFLAMTSYNLENYDKAIEYLEKAYDFYSTSTVKKRLANIYFLFGNIYLAKGNQTKAFEYNFKALGYYQILNNQQNIAETYIRISNLYLQDKKYQNALDYAQKALNLASKNNYLIIKKQSYQILSNVNAIMGNLNQALKYKDKYVLMSDSIFDDIRQKQSYELRENFELQKRQNEVQVLQWKNERQELELANRKYLVLGLIILGIMGLSIIVVLIFRNNEKTKANKLLYEKNAEISKQKYILEETLDQLSEREQQLREANLSKTKIFSIIGHDLRSPIGNLKSMIELMLESPESYDQKSMVELLNMLKNSAASTFNLLENLLLWATSQQGEIIFAPERINLNSIIDENLNLLASNAQVKSIKLTKRFDKPYLVYADKNMLSSVLRNLISNAIKFTNEQGEVIIKAEDVTENIPDKDKYIKVSVIDSGVGIRPESLEKIFDPNQLFVTPGTNKEKGSGLGLIICKDFVEKNGGNLTIDSQTGRGSIFSFTLKKD